jgi:hypothetical protein
MSIYDSALLDSSYNQNFWEKSIRENQNTHFVFNNHFQKSCRLWDNVEK